MARITSIVRDFCALQRRQGIGIARTDACQSQYLDRNVDRIADGIAQTDEHVVEFQPALVERQLRFVQLDGVFGRIDSGDYRSPIHSLAVPCMNGDDRPRDRKRQRTAFGGDQTAVADEFADEIAAAQRIDGHFVAFDAVLHVVGRCGGFLLRIGAAAGAKGDANQRKQRLFHGKRVIRR